MFVYLFAFLGGIFTVLSPCVVPVLPIILSGGVGSRWRPWGIVAGFCASFVLATLFLSLLVRSLGLDADLVRFIAITVLLVLGGVLAISRINKWLTQVLGRLVGGIPQARGSGLGGGVLTGVSLGLVWSPCVGPIMAAVITAGVTGRVTLETFIIAVLYACGTAIPMLAVMHGGRALVARSRWLVRDGEAIERFMGWLIILVAVGLIFSIDRNFQVWMLTTFPGWALWVTGFERIGL